MFTFSPYPDLHQPKAPRLVIGGYGKTFYINKDSSPFLEIETGPNSWNPFNAECFFQHYFCIGNGDKAYFVDLYTKEIKTFSCDMYFGYFYIYQNRMFAASNARLSCFGSNCELLWQTKEIALDGVIVNEFSEDTLSVSCEIDPPSHWVQYRISIQDGNILP